VRVIALLSVILFSLSSLAYDDEALKANHIQGYQGDNYQRFGSCGGEVLSLSRNANETIRYSNLNPQQKDIYMRAKTAILLNSYDCETIASDLKSLMRQARPIPR